MKYLVGLFIFFSLVYGSFTNFQYQERRAVEMPKNFSLAFSTISATLSLIGTGLGTSSAIALFDSQWSDSQIGGIVNVAILPFSLIIAGININYAIASAMSYKKFKLFKVKHLYSSKILMFSGISAIVLAGTLLGGILPPLSARIYGEAKKHGLAYVVLFAISGVFSISSSFAFNQYQAKITPYVFESKKTGKVYGIGISYNF